ncbi:MAG: methyltransferase domain-containing protein [Alphaproteobacteria bacterium]|uniref:Methyltransferase domain-containing protein n=1 Tax=Candidatus Nitrobium versatile TaxID=2884831 RepID=A0A953M1S7_9BACT|nr:methyltransferase domain-containing protein [Candidatus Nitrobium versatile]
MEESASLGQFIPLHYHYNMLSDTHRLQGFQEAIHAMVRPGSRVLELGGGTGVLSFFAARKASKVWCVERNPELVREARRILSRNPGAERVEVIEADAFEYLPPEPVEVVICEMIHVGMLREKQVPVLSSFKQRYREKFHAPLPLFIPEAAIQAVQPVQQSFDFSGFHAPVPLFQHPYSMQSDTKGLGEPLPYQILSYREDLPGECTWKGEVTVTEAGLLNAFRFITKNILGVVPAENRTIDWFSQYLVVPLEEPLPVERGERVTVSFFYRPGDPLETLSGSLAVMKD